jgi:hypothetical protein
MSNGGGGSLVTLREEQGKAMTDSEYMPSSVDPATPSVARMYDYYLGGCFP